MVNVTLAMDYSLSAGCASATVVPPPLSIAGMTGIALSFSMLFIHGSGVYLVFAAIFIVMMIVPGHIMNKQMKKQCLKN